VPALREAVKAWRAGGYKGIADTTRERLNYWFHTDHRLPNGTPFEYHSSQQEAIETLIFVWEVEQVRNRQDLLRRYAPPTAVRIPPEDSFARYCTKMATGSGKTKIMSLAVAWQFLNSQRETGPEAEEYARTFLLIAPNVIVLERLKTDFAGSRVFRSDPIVPKHMLAFWDFDCVLRGEGPPGRRAGEELREPGRRGPQARGGLRGGRSECPRGVGAGPWPERTMAGRRWRHPPWAHSPRPQSSRPPSSP
jgi:type III restriction enzyme